MSYDGYWAVTTACNDMVNGLRRGATAVKGVYFGDGHSATSPAQVGTATGRNSGPSSSSTRYFVPRVVICTPSGTNRGASANSSMGSPAARGAELEIYVSLLYH
jgi:hypothetical protein